MKRKLFGTLAIALAVCNLTSSFVSEASFVQGTQKHQVKSHSNQEEKATSWNYKDLEIEVFQNGGVSDQDRKKFETDIALMLSNDKNAQTQNSTITSNNASNGDPSYVPIGEGGATTISGPAYKTHDNTVTNFIVEASVRTVSFYLLAQVKSPAWLQGTVQTWLVYLHGWLNTHQYAYVGYKTSKAWNSYYGYYEIYETIVFYENSNYTSPSKVYYYGTGQNAASYGY
ncbi:hypothetical protein [Tumebacillus lipolyticus]|uniref:Uncharacterized protein n=1 Tax=Tumebacillus lipolyticus TaxID=1280370 RepID=A0ABW4ZSK0_9BACL